MSQKGASHRGLTCGLSPLCHHRVASSLSQVVRCCVHLRTCSISHLQCTHAQLLPQDSLLTMWWQDDVGRCSWMESWIRTTVKYQCTLNMGHRCWMIDTLERTICWRALADRSELSQQQRQTRLSHPSSPVTATSHRTLTSKVDLPIRTSTTTFANTRYLKN